MFCKKKISVLTELEDYRVAGDSRLKDFSDKHGTTARPPRGNITRVRPRAVAAPYVNDNPDPTKRCHYFELSVLCELRGALRAGDVWLEGSRRYADPQTYLIPPGGVARSPGGRVSGDSGFGGRNGSSARA